MRQATVGTRLPSRHLEHMASRVPSIRAALRRPRGRSAWRLVGLSRPVQPADARPGWRPTTRARGLLLWTGAVHAGGPRHADRLRLRHGPLPSGDLHGPGADPADAPVLDDVVPSAEAASEVVFSVSGKSIPCTEADTVLAISRQAGLNIPSGCNWRLRHLQDEEAVGRGAWCTTAASPRTTSPPATSSPAARIRWDGSRSRPDAASRGRSAAWAAHRGPRPTELGRTRASHPRHEPPGLIARVVRSHAPGTTRFRWPRTFRVVAEHGNVLFGVSRVSRQGR